MTTRILTFTLMLALVGPLAAAGQGGPPDHAGPPDDAGATLTKTLLTRADDASDDDVVGRVETLSIANSGRERFRVVVCLLDAEATVSVTIGDGADGTIDLGEITADDEGHAVLDLDTNDGDDLPGGVDSLADLEGRVVTVLDAEDAVLLSGAVGSADDSLDHPWKRKMTFQAATGEGPKVKTRLQQRTRDRERLKLQVKKLDPDQNCELWVEDPGTGLMVRAMECAANRHGTVKLKLRARGDEELIPGLGGAGDLAGLAFQIRTTGGQTLVSGTFPAP